jgi:DnaJ like chaperone protein
MGHAADQGALGGRSFGRPSPGQAAEIAAMLGSREQLFAISVVVLAAKLAKCDGAVKRMEVDAFKELFRIPPENLREVGILFDQARIVIKISIKNIFIIFTNGVIIITSLIPVQTYN